MTVDAQIRDRAKHTDLASLVERCGIKLTKQGANHVGLCPFHNENSPSFNIFPDGGYKCFGCGAGGGDAIQFVREFEGVGFPEAVRKLVGNLPADTAPRAKRDIEREEPEQEWLPMAVVPDSAPLPMDTLNRKIDGKWHKLVASTRWEYHNADGSLIGYVYRFDKPGGGKEVMPQVYCTNMVSGNGEMAWRWMSFPKPRPLYGLEKLARNPKAQVLIVEGEKACDAAQAHFKDAGIPEDNLVVVSWPGGGKAVKHVDWSPLRGRRVVLWPDADLKTYIDKHPKAGELMPFEEQPGTVAMFDVLEAVREHSGEVKFVTPPADVPDGWDLADPFPEGFDLKKHAKTARVVHDTVTVVLAKTADVLALAAREFGAIDDGATLNAPGVGSRGTYYFKFDTYGEDVASSVAAARKAHPKAHIYVIAEPGDEQAARDAADAHDAEAEILIEQAGGPFETWAAYFEAARAARVATRNAMSKTADAVRDAAQVVEQASAAVSSSTVSDAAREIGDAIAWRLSKALGVDERDERLGIDLAAIDRMIGGSFWSGGKSKLFMLNEAQTLNQFVAGDAYRFLTRACGSPVDAKAVAEMTEQYVSANNLDKAEEKEVRRATAAAAESVIVDHLKYHNQREKVEWRCDMFASNAHMHLREDTARVVLMHKPFEVRGGYEQAIIDDYKQHFTRFDEFLKFLVQSRFALDRKKCYLWILADSDWGKGFLLGVLRELRLTVETSMAEIEAMLEGKPVGRSPEEFKRAFALVVDEFKVVKSELKSLQSEISLSPKNQLSSSVEVFAKIFLSAESVASLVTENGVEDQFANRMSIFAERGTLESRPLYEEVGNPRYFESVLNYTAETLNRLVAEMQAFGRLESQDGAQRWIKSFIAEHGIDTVYERFSDSLPNVAAEVLAWLYAESGRLQNDAGHFYLSSANKVLDTYLYEHFDASEVHAYRRRKPEILRLLSVDGKGAHTHRVGGAPRMCVVVMPPGSSGVELSAAKAAVRSGVNETF
ncbi:CHC2 zinc finger domain-containing protein [Paraburkholderia solisilvae]|uniref:DNA primase n=1 Tax=Paraburkholderia solisilvae TaxID=624376 RepID=A0A6J5DIJ0_9BURK|nr:CHC2 zinc finger domain-containing protein [Paraburkholderia solisilvae]CAB3753061.1 DNA primase [Paraburkholderia solisilvae]